MNLEYSYIERTPTTKEYNHMRNSVGWNKLESDAVRQALPNSLFCICVEKNNEIIGFGRLVGDGGICFIIQEIIIKPTHQGKGVGTQILKNLMGYIKNNAHDGSYISLMAGKGLEKFYERFGFWKRPTKRMGPGMIQFWNDQPLNNYCNEQ